MKRDHSTTVRQPPLLTIWVLWFLVTGGYGVVLATEISFRGADEIYLSGYSPYLGGPLLGVLQGLMLRHYFGARNWWTWILSSSIGWFIALLILTLLGGIVQMGGGLNPETDVRNCLLVVCGLAGGVFGLLQALFPPISLDVAVWMITNAFAVAMGALVGGIIGFTVYDALLAGRPVDFDAPEYTMCVALGVLAAMLVVGAITGAAAMWHLRMHSRTLS